MVYSVYMSKEPRKLVVLLDSHAIIHRAYHGMPDFTSSTGEPTGALYGLSTMLLKILTMFKPDYVIACYDLPQPTFRHEAYDGYKGGRAKTDDALVHQLQTSRTIFEAFGIPMYDKPGFEADDMLGTIVEQVHANKMPLDIVIASGDMDTLQLVDGDTVRVFTLRKGINDTVIYNEDEVVKRFGFGPALIPDYKGLRGDPSDNIIGIAGIGEKTATTLITQFGTIESIYKKLKKDEQPFRDAGITPRIIELLKAGEDEALFSKTLATIRRDAPVTFVLPEKTFVASLQYDKLDELFRHYEFRSLVGKVKTVLSGAPIETKESVVSTLDPEDKRKLGLLYWLINSENINPTDDDVLYFKGAKTQAESEQNLLKSISDEKLDFVCNEIELPLLPIIIGMEQYGIKLDIPFLEKLAKEYHGELSRIEKEIYALAGREFNINSPKQLGEVLFDELKIHEGKKLKKTAGGARTTKESELEKLRDAHPIVALIMQQRELQKLLATYIDVLPGLVHTDGRIHATFNQAGAATGRFSSTDPNLQNIPVKTDLGKKIRDAFVAPAGSKLVSFDYSQIELRIAALMSQDEYLLRVFQEGKDIHAAVASRVFGVPESEVTQEMRRRAKVINFGILYGMGVTALQTNLGTTRAEAQVFYDNYFAQFPTIQAYLDGVVAEAKKTGYTTTLYGRRRYFTGLRSPMQFVRAMAERMAINAPIQGTSADIIKVAIRVAHEALDKAGLLDKAHLVLQVHDELVYEIQEDSMAVAVPIIENAMKAVLPPDILGDRTPVPFEVHVAVGNNWGELK